VQVRSGQSRSVWRSSSTLGARMAAPLVVIAAAWGDGLAAEERAAEEMAKEWLRATVLVVAEAQVLVPTRVVAVTRTGRSLSSPTPCQQLS